MLQLLALGLILQIVGVNLSCRVSTASTNIRGVTSCTATSCTSRVVTSCTSYTSIHVTRVLVTNSGVMHYWWV